jgi:hypothetical protein
MRDQPQIRVPVRAIITWSCLVFVAAWAFAFFTQAGWSFFTAFTEAAGHSAALGPAMHQVILAGGGPTPAPTLLLFAPLVPGLGVVIWSLSLLSQIGNAPYDPLERYKPREPIKWRKIPLFILFMLLNFHGLAGFPLAVRLFGTDFLISAWPAFAVGAGIVALTCATLFLILRIPAPKD